VANRFFDGAAVGSACANLEGYFWEYWRELGGDHKLKVFISYSRRDEDFAQELLVGLEIAGFEPYLDKHDMAAARIGKPGSVG
jgi:hypothetical protein